MDLSELRLEVRERVGELSADFFTDVEVDRAINDGIKRFTQEEKWPFMLTEWSSSTAADDAEVELPSNISLNRIFNLAVSDGGLSRPQLLRRVDPKEGFQLRYDYQDRPGAPVWYYVSKSDLSDNDAPPIVYTARLIPVPDAEYTIEALYWAVPVTLTGASEEPMVPDEYQEAICAWAAGKLFLKEHQVSQKSSEQFQLYQKVVFQARQDLRTFGADEIVAWGRREPLRRESNVRGRITPTLG